MIISLASASNIFKTNGDMKKNMQLEVPQPCQEKWNHMTTTVVGKHCNACNKEVVDFSQMSDDQVLQYFSKSTNHVC
jgi:hypothetical protein